MHNVTIPEDKNWYRLLASMPWEQGHVYGQWPKLRGLPLTPHDLKTIFEINIEGTNYTFEKTSFINGRIRHMENYRPFEITVPAYVNLDNKVYAFTDENQKRWMYWYERRQIMSTAPCHLPYPMDGVQNPKSNLSILKQKELENYSFWCMHLMSGPVKAWSQLKLKSKTKYTISLWSL